MVGVRAGIKRKLLHSVVREAGLVNRFDQGLLRGTERNQCSTEDNRECFDLILQLRKYASVIRREGFLALEEELKNIGDEFLAISIQMGIDGVAPALFRDIQERRILVDNCTGKELLRRVVITEAMASILSQDTFMTFHYKLLSYLGEHGYKWAKEDKLDLIGKSH